MISDKRLTMLLGTFLKYKPGHYPLALLLARTGMRIGEAVALNWDGIDFITKRLQPSDVQNRSLSLKRQVPQY